MNSCGILALLLLCAEVYTYTPFSLTDCSTSDTRLAIFDNVRLGQYPITIPGDVQVSATLTIPRPIVDNYRLDVWVEKYILFEYFPLPCINRIGSCAYDLCDLLDWFQDRGCPWQLRASNSFPCRCPFENGTHTLRPHPFNIPRVTGAWQWIAFGDYRITGKVTDTLADEEVGCYTVEFTTQAEPQDYSWLWNW